MSQEVYLKCDICGATAFERRVGSSHGISEEKVSGEVKGWSDVMVWTSGNKNDEDLNWDTCPNCTELILNAMNVIRSAGKVHEE